MQRRYPNGTPDQAQAPVQPRTLDNEPTQPVPVEPVQPVQPIEPVQPVRVLTGSDRATMIVWLVLGILEALLIMRVVLKLLGANPVAGFVQLVYGVTAPFVAPFQGIFPTPETSRSILELSSLVAVVVYALLAWGIVRIIAILNTRQGQSTM